MEGDFGRALKLKCHKSKILKALIPNSDTYFLSWPSLELASGKLGEHYFIPIINSAYIRHGYFANRNIKNTTLFFSRYLKKFKLIYFQQESFNDLQKRNLKYLSLDSNKVIFYKDVNSIKIEQKNRACNVIIGPDFDSSKHAGKVSAFLALVTQQYKQVNLIAFDGGIDAFAVVAENLKLTVITLPKYSDYNKYCYGFKFFWFFYSKWILKRRLGSRAKRLIVYNNPKIPTIYKKALSLATYSHPLLTNINIFTGNLKAAFDNQSFDLVHSVDLISFLSSAELKEFDNQRHIIDINEIPETAYRTGWQFYTMPYLLKRQMEQEIKKKNNVNCQFISSSEGFTHLMHKKFGIKAMPVRKYSKSYQTTKNNMIRKDFNIPAEAIIIVHVCTFAKQYGSNELLDIIKLLPEDYYLVFVGSPDKVEYFEEINALAEQLNLNNRVFFKKPILDKNSYLDYIKGANIGIVNLPKKEKSNLYNLSNRFADLMAAAIPVVSSYSIEVEKIISKYKIGSIVENEKASDYAFAVQNILKDQIFLENFEDESKRARLEFNADAELNKYRNIIYKIKSNAPNTSPKALLVFNRGIVRNQRAIQFAREISRAGFSLTIACSRIPDNDLLDGLEDVVFVQISSTHKLAKKNV